MDKMYYWCSNTLTIYGNMNDLENFFIENKDGENNLSFSKSVSPSHMIEPKWITFDYEDFYLDDEGEELWGCGTDCHCFHIDKNTDHYIYRFDTPNTPPLQWMECVSKKYPDILFDILSEELFQDYYLRMVVHDGRRISFDQCRLQEKFYESSNGDNLAKILLEKLKKSEIINDFVHGKKNLLDFSNKEIEDDLNDHDCYDYLDYLESRMRDLYLGKS